MVMLRFPAPVNADDFDWLVSAIAERKYSCTAMRYGRNGQAQHGVDITVDSPRGGLIAIQSKHVLDLTEEGMSEEIDKFFGINGRTGPFSRAVEEFIFATSADRDTKHTDHAQVLAGLHAPLRVSVWAWQSINEMLNTMPTLASQYTAAVLTPYLLEESRARHAFVLRRALDRPALLDGFQYEFDFSAQAAALRMIAGFIRTGNVYDSSFVLVDSAHPYDDQDDYGKALEKLRAELLALARYIETHRSGLQQWQLTSGGRQIDASNVEMAKTYIDFEAKRVKIVKTANRILTKEHLAPLPS